MKMMHERNVGGQVKKRKTVINTALNVQRIEKQVKIIITNRELNDKQEHKGLM